MVKLLYKHKSFKKMHHFSHYDHVEELRWFIGVNQGHDLFKVLFRGIGPVILAETREFYGDITVTSLSIRLITDRPHLPGLPGDRCRPDGSAAR